MSWWNEGTPPTSSRVLRGPRVSAARPTSFLVDPSKVRPKKAAAPAPPVEEEPVPEEPGAETVDRSEIDRLTAEHAAALDTAVREAYDRGHAAAMDELAIQARETEEKLTARVDSAAAALVAAAEMIEQARREAVVAAEEEAAELAFKLTRALVGRETVLSENATVDAIKRALALAPTNGDVVIRLHPDDIATLTGYDMDDLGRSCTVVADETVEHSGCIIEVGATRIDGQMGQALGRVRKVLLGMHGDHPDTDPTGRERAAAAPERTDATGRGALHGVPGGREEYDDDAGTGDTGGGITAAAARGRAVRRLDREERAS